MPQSYECKLCPNYPCLAVRLHGEENMQSNPCPYEVANGLRTYGSHKERFAKVVNEKAPLVLNGKR